MPLTLPHCLNSRAVIIRREYRHLTGYPRR